MNIINLARSTVKTIYINLRIFPFFKAVRFPIVASYDVIFEGCRKNCIELLDDTVKFASIKVGFYDGTGHMAKDKNTVISIDRNCTLKVGHDVTIAKGSIIRISSGGGISIGNGFKGGPNLHIFAQKKITIESGCLVGWNVTLMDRDGHNIYDLNGTHINPNNDVYIGSNVWLCSYCSILKGSKVGENSIVGYGAIVSNDFKEGNIIVAGIPAKCVRSKVNWTI